MAEYNDGLILRGNHSRAWWNMLGDKVDPNGPNGGLRILAGGGINGIGQDVQIDNNVLYFPTVTPIVFKGIESSVYGNAHFIRANTIEGVKGSSDDPATGIRLILNNSVNVIDWAISNNTIKSLTPSTNSIGIWIFGSGSLDGFDEATVEGANSFPDSSVNDKVLYEPTP